MGTAQKARKALGRTSRGLYEIMASFESGLRTLILGMVINLTLAVIKVVTGVVGNSYALVADGIESTTDIFSSLLVWGGLRISVVPADEHHPYGHGKAESMTAAVAALGLLAAAAAIAAHSVREIRVPHQAPAWFTLPVLLAVVAAKELLFRSVLSVGTALDSTSLKVDAWHHRSDALTSAATGVGVGIGVIGGEGYESADDWAALVACGVIAFNGLALLRSAVHDIMDAAVSPDIQRAIRTLAEGVEGVLGIEKVRIRKSGLGLWMDIHVEVDPDMTVTKGHEIAHRVRDVLVGSDLRIQDVVVHIEPRVMPPPPPRPPAPPWTPR